MNSNGSDLSEIRRLATEFRKAIERCPRERLPVAFTDFPRGACGDAAPLLAKFLERNGYSGFAYILGMRGGGSHAWLSRGNLIVDITADQFEDQSHAVIVETESNWHTSFRVDCDDQRHPADFEKYNEAAAATLASAYVAIVDQMPRVGHRPPDHPFRR